MASIKAIDLASKNCERCKRDFTGEQTHPIRIATGKHNMGVFELACPDCAAADLDFANNISRLYPELAHASKSDERRAVMDRWRAEQRAKYA